METTESAAAILELVPIVPQRLRDARVAKGMTQYELAAAAGSTSQTDVSKRERVPGSMSRRKFEDLARALNVSEAWLSGLSNVQERGTPSAATSQPVVRLVPPPVAEDDEAVNEPTAAKEVPVPLLRTHPDRESEAEIQARFAPKPTAKPPTTVPVLETAVGLEDILAILQEEQEHGLVEAAAKVARCEGVMREGEREITEALSYGRLAFDEYHTALRADVQGQLRARITGKPQVLRAPSAANMVIDQMVSLEAVVGNLIKRLRIAIHSDMPISTAPVTPEPRVAQETPVTARVEQPVTTSAPVAAPPAPPAATVASPAPKPAQVVAKAAPGAVVVKQKGKDEDEDYRVPDLTPDSVGRVIMVGGQYPPHIDVVRLAKRECNVDLEWISTKERKVDGLVARLKNGTPDIKGLLVITSHIGHDVSGKVRLAAVSGKIPTSHVQSHGHGQIVKEIRKFLATPRPS